MPLAQPGAPSSQKRKGSRGPHCRGTALQGGRIALRAFRYRGLRSCADTIVGWVKRRDDSRSQETPALTTSRTRTWSAPRRSPSFEPVQLLRVPRQRGIGLPARLLARRHSDRLHVRQLRLAQGQRRARVRRRVAPVPRARAPSHDVPRPGRSPRCREHCGPLGSGFSRRSLSFSLLGLLADTMALVLEMRCARPGWCGWSDTTPS